MWLGFLQSVVFDFSIFRMEHPPELGNLSEVFFDGSIGKSKVAHDAASQVVRHHEVNLKLTEQDHFSNPPQLPQASANAYWTTLGVSRTALENR